MSDIEIARSAKLKNILEVAKDLGIEEDNVELYNKYLKTTNVKGSLSIELERGI